MHLPGLAAIAGTLFLFKLGTGALLNWDEAIYAEVPKEMARSGDWLTPIWQGRPFFEKPPLSFWIQGAFFHWFGVNEFVARLPSALAGIAVVLLTYAIAQRLAGAAAGLLAALVLMTTSEFDRVTREGMRDTLLCLYGIGGVGGARVSGWVILNLAMVHPRSQSAAANGGGSPQGIGLTFFIFA